MIKCFFKADIRQKNLLFWDWIFPIILMIGAAAFVGRTNSSVSILSGLISFLILQTLIFGIPFRLCEYQEKGTLQLIAEEGNIVKFLGSFLITRMITVAVQCIIFIPSGAFLMEIPLNINLFDLIISISLAIMIFGGISIIIAVGISNQQSAFGFAQLIYLVLTMTSGIFYPLEKSPNILQVASKFSPLTYIKEIIAISLDYEYSYLENPLIFKFILFVVGVVLIGLSFIMIDKRLNRRIKNMPIFLGK